MERSQYSYAKIVPNQWRPATSSEKTLFVLYTTYTSNISAIAKRNPLCFCHSKVITTQRGFIFLNIFVEAGFKDNSGKKLVYLI